MPRGTNNSRGASGGGSIRKKVIKRNGKEYQYWEARYTSGYNPTTGRQIQHSITGKTQKEVAQKLRQVTAAIDQGLYKEPSRLTVGQWLEIWINDYVVNVKPRTLEAYRCQINNHILPELGSIQLEKLRPHVIQHFYNGCHKTLSAKSVKNIHGILHRALQQAVAIGYLRSNPTESCVLPRVEKKPIKPLDDDAIRRFMTAIKGHRFECVYLVTLFTGMRRGEVFGLTWDCVDFQQGTLLINKQLQKIKDESGRTVYSLVTTKNSKARKITPAAFVMALLRQQKSRQTEQRLRVGPAWADKDLVFSDELGDYLKPHVAYDSFKKIVAQIGCPEARFHDLRHSYAVAAIKSGDDIKTIQGNLGHATAAFTLDVYGHVTDQMQRESAQRMEEYIHKISG